MSNGTMNAFERLFKLWATICKMILDGVRDIEKVIAVLQAINDGDCKPHVPNWARAYEALGMSAEYAEFIKANPIEGNPNLWVVPVLEGVTCNNVVAALRKVMRERGEDVSLYVENLDKGVSTNDCDPKNGSYVVGFVKNVEADEENKSKSANTLAEVGHKGITLLERLLLELGYFLATGEHLDAKNITLCAGSRGSSGNVPSVYWSAGNRWVYVKWCSPGHAYEGLRSRSVSFLAPKPANAG